MSSPTPTPQPVHCRLEAYDYLADQLCHINRTPNLLRAGIAIAMHELEDLDVKSVEQELDQLAQKISLRVNSNEQRAIIAHAHEVLFAEERFKGCRHDYYNPKHSYLPQVVKTRRGLPIILSLIYKYILEQLGVDVVGIGVPGHFIVEIEIKEMDGHPASIQLIDPFFSGRMMTGEEVTRRAQKMTGQSFTVDEIFKPVNNKQWIRRIILNLIKSFDQRGRHEDIAAMHEMLALVERSR